MPSLDWEVVYKKAINDDGSLLFPQKLSHEFLNLAKRTMGSYLFANQYLNEIIPAELQTFKRVWFKYIDHLPKNYTTFMFVDPALSEADGSDFTGIVVMSVDADKNWYVRYAQRHRLTPTQLITKVFEFNKMFSPNVIGIEEIAYQKALLYFLDEEMRRRNVILPVKGIRYPNQKSKQARILSMVPRFEFGHMLLNQGLQDLELELLTFPRGSHDDLIDALAAMEYIYYPPAKEDEWALKPAPNHEDYERYYIHNLLNKKTQGDE